MQNTDAKPEPRRHSASGGIIHTYQRYDPQRIPSPNQPQENDLVSPVFDHMLQWGNLRELSEEELANAVRLSPDQIAGLGPSLQSILAMLQERLRNILARYETHTVRRRADKAWRRAAAQTKPPKSSGKLFRRAVREEQIYQLERLWYHAERRNPHFASRLLHLMERLGEKYQVDELDSRWKFTGSESLTIPEAIELLEELKRLEELIEQIKQAENTAQIAIVDLETLEDFTSPETAAEMAEFQKQVSDYLRDQLERQGLNTKDGAVQLTPRAYSLFQGRLLSRLFEGLQESRPGRHDQPLTGDGAVETQRTRPYEFGDSVAQMDIPATMLNAMLRQPGHGRIQLDMRDIEIHQSKNRPRCATSVVMDMSGSMRYDGQYINVKKMALALNGLIRSQYAGDMLRFVEIHTVAKVVPPGDIISLMPKIPTITDPVVRLKADMSNEDLSEMHLPPHFTNIQHGLQLSRRMLATQDTPNRQIILITDGLPTAHFDGSDLFMLYPPDTLTEEATMREGQACSAENITINIFLLPSWSQSEEDVRFAHRLAEQTGGRVFFTAGHDLDRFVIWDYVSQRREIIG